MEEDVKRSHDVGFARHLTKLIEKSPAVIGSKNPARLWLAAGPAAFRWNEYAHNHPHPMPSLALVNRQRRVRVDTQWLRRAAKTALPICCEVSDEGKALLPDLTEVVVAIVSDPVIAQIHVDFMGIEGPTDVITFDHGEIVISADTAKACAARFGHPIEQELALYTIHGLLHLNGFDDLTPAPAARMRKTQTRILRQIVQQHPFSPISR